MEPLKNDVLLSAYLDGELTADEQASVEALLATNAEARQLVEELRALRGSLEDLPRYSLEADFAQRVLRKAEKVMLLGDGLPAVISANATQDQARHDTAAVVSPQPWQAPRWINWRGMAWAAAAVAAAILLVVTNRDPVRQLDDREIAQLDAQRERARKQTDAAQVNAQSGLPKVQNNQDEGEGLTEGTAAATAVVEQQQPVQSALESADKAVTLAESAKSSESAADRAGPSALTVERSLTRPATCTADVGSADANPAAATTKSLAPAAEATNQPRPASAPVADGVAAPANAAPADEARGMRRGAVADSPVENKLFGDAKAGGLAPLPTPPSAGMGGGGGVPGGAPSDQQQRANTYAQPLRKNGSEAFRTQRDEAAKLRGDASDSELLVVHIEMTQEALVRGEFAALLANNRIVLEENSTDKQKRAHNPRFGYQAVKPSAKVPTKTEDRYNAADTKRADGDAQLKGEAAPKSDAGRETEAAASRRLDQRQQETGESLSPLDIIYLEASPEQFNAALAELRSQPQFFPTVEIAGTGNETFDNSPVLTDGHAPAAVAKSAPAPTAPTGKANEKNDNNADQPGRARRLPLSAFDGAAERFAADPLAADSPAPGAASEDAAPPKSATPGAPLTAAPAESNVVPPAGLDATAPMDAVAPSSNAALAAGQSAAASAPTAAAAAPTSSRTKRAVFVLRIIETHPKSPTPNE